MLAPRPTTWPSFAFHELRANPRNMLLARLWLLHGNHPADPLIAREWGDIVPHRPRSPVSQ